MDALDFRKQLSAVEEALTRNPNIGERADLEALRENLIELLELEAGAAATNVNDVEQEDTAVYHNGIDDKIREFMFDLGQSQSTSSTSDEGEHASKRDFDNIGSSQKGNNFDFSEPELMRFLEDYEKLVGKKVQAPYGGTADRLTYHNAVVYAVGTTPIIDADSGGIADMPVRVLFTNPTSHKMLTCKSFLEGDCRLDSDDCLYSHGVEVAAKKLGVYEAPRFEQLAVKCSVLAKMDDDLWVKGRVLFVDFEEQQCHVRIQSNFHKERKRVFDFEHLFPKPDIASSGDESNDSDVEDANCAVKYTDTSSKDLFTVSSTEALGAWEKHTRGIGSKLMSKMGYVYGTGLGSTGQGIVTPVSAQVLPQGCSLDHCMNLREAANGDQNLFSVEKRLKREQKKQEALNAKSYLRTPQQKDNVFTFLNDTILSGCSNKEDSGKSNVQARSSTLQQQSTKSLNVESVRLADEMRRKERDIAKMKESLRRNASNSQTHKRLQVQLNAKQSELNSMQKMANSLSREQETRKNKDKLFIF